MDGIRAEFAAVKSSVMTAANKAPESIYGYQPTPEVFTLRKMLLHIADASYSICARLQGHARSATEGGCRRAVAQGRGHCRR